MTKDDVIRILKEYGISVKENGDLTIRSGEKVGDYFDFSDSLFIAEYIQSYIGRTYETVNVDMIEIENPDAETMLRRLLSDLLNTMTRYEEALRREKVNKIRNYFEYMGAK